MKEYFCFGSEDSAYEAVGDGEVVNAFFESEGDKGICFFISKLELSELPPVIRKLNPATIRRVNGFSVFRINERYKNIQDLIPTLSGVEYCIHLEIKFNVYEEVIGTGDSQSNRIHFIRLNAFKTQVLRVILSQNPMIAFFMLPFPVITQSQSGFAQNETLHTGIINLPISEVRQRLGIK